MMLDVQVEQRGSFFIFRLSGRIDTLTAAVLEDRVVHARNNGALDLIFNIAGVDYISSAGLRVFFSTAQKLRSNKGELFCSSPTPNIQSLFAMTGAEKFFKITAHEHEAVQYISSR